MLLSPTEFVWSWSKGELSSFKLRAEGCLNQINLFWTEHKQDLRLLEHAENKRYRIAQITISLCAKSCLESWVNCPAACAGWEEIIRLKEKLEGSPQFNSSHFLILALHSMVPAAEQREVFVRPPPGRQKVSLPTLLLCLWCVSSTIWQILKPGRAKPHKEISSSHSAITQTNCNWAKLSVSCRALCR